MKTNDKFMMALGALIVIGFFCLMVLLVKLPIPAENKDMFNIVIGALVGSFLSVVGYYFGSSLGSKSKDETIANSTPITTNENK